MCSQCGNLKSVCSDPSIDWHPRTSVCWATASRHWAQRLLQERFKDKEPTRMELHPLDGKAVWVSDIPPPKGEDEFRL